MLHAYKSVTWDIIINFMNAYILGLKNDALCQSSKVIVWIKLSIRANASHVLKTNSIS